jgi:hypothetical protein
MPYHRAHKRKATHMRGSPTDSLQDNASPNTYASGCRTRETVIPAAVCQCQGELGNCDCVLHSPRRYVTVNHDCVGLHEVDDRHDARATRLTTVNVGLQSRATVQRLRWV